MRFNYLDYEGKVESGWIMDTEDAVNNATSEYSGIENRVAGMATVLAFLIEETLVTPEKVAEFLTKISRRKVAVAEDA